MASQAPLDHEPARDAYRWVDAAIQDMQHLRRTSVRTDEVKHDYWHGRILSHLVAVRVCIEEVLQHGQSKVY